MPSQGPNSGSAAADSTAEGLGTVAWAFAAGALTAGDLIEAQAALGWGAVSHYLHVTDFGFTIPAGSTVNGIVVEFLVRAGGANNIETFATRPLKGGVVTTGSYGGASFWPTTSAYETTGTTTELWGETWAAADVNASNFGAATSAINNSPGHAADTGYVDHCRITVYYTAGFDPTAFPWGEGQPRRHQTRTRVTSYGHVPGVN